MAASARGRLWSLGVPVGYLSWLGTVESATSFVDKSGCNRCTLSTMEINGVYDGDMRDYR